MTAHDHSEFVEGCYRCDLSRDEVDDRTEASRAPQPTDDDREALANLIPLGFTERDPVRNVYEAADRILAAGFRRGAPAVTDAMVEAFTVAINRAGYVLDRDATRVGLRAALTTKERQGRGWEPVTPEEEQ